jgi:AAA15 family ATPase/GTPase
MTSTTLKDSEDGLFTIGGGLDPENGKAQGKSLRVSAVSGVYGGNAAGKSTLLKALNFFCEAVVSSHTRTSHGEGTPYYPFKLDETSRDKSSHYDVDVAIENTRYHYGYKLDGKKIVLEWLYSYDLTASRQTRTVLFVRETNENFETEFNFGKSLRGENKQISKLVRANSLYLSTAAQNAHPQLTPLFDFFYKKMVRRLDDETSLERLSEQMMAYFGSNQQRQNVALNFLKAADIGIVGMDFSHIPVDEKEILLLQEFEQVVNRHFDSPEGKIKLGGKKEKARINLLHSGANNKTYPIDLKRESAGTLSLLQLIGPAFARLNEGGVLVVDELNSTLHPLVSREFVRLFSNPVTNPGKAQLIFTTHDTNLLTGNLLRRDQIWFAEKSGDGATEIYALSDIKIRSDDNFERGYLTGRFGAVPFVGCSLSDFVKNFALTMESGDGASES